MQHQHLRSISRLHELPRPAVAVLPPTTLLGKIAQALGLKQF
jgi:hypothetical protein